MSDPINFAGLPALPQIQFLYELVPTLWQRPEVQAIWLEGSLGRGNADLYSDVDLYVGVAPAALEQWRAVDLKQLFGDHYAAHHFSLFAEDFFVYHVYTVAGGIYDLHIQPTTRALPKVNRLILAARDEAYRAALLAAAPDPAADSTLVFTPQSLDPSTLPPLFILFWINADKGRKVIYRNQDLTTYTGLHLYRQMLARLLFIEQTGTDCGDLTRPTIHGLKAAATVLGAALGDKLGQLMGAPATTRAEFAQAQELLYEEFARVGRVLAERYQIEYPAALEGIILTNWQNFKADVLGLTSR